MGAGAWRGLGRYPRPASRAEDDVQVAVRSDNELADALASGGDRRAGSVGCAVGGLPQDRAHRLGAQTCDEGIARLDRHWRSVDSRGPPCATSTTLPGRRRSPLGAIGFGEAAMARTDARLGLGVLVSSNAGPCWEPYRRAEEPFRGGRSPPTLGSSGPAVSPTAGEMMTSHCPVDLGVPVTVTSGPAFLPPQATARSVLDTDTSVVDRYLGASLAGWAPRAETVQLRMRGLVRVGRRWWPFRAMEVLGPRHGFTRITRLGGVVQVVDTALPDVSVRRVSVAGRVCWEDDSRDPALRARAHLTLGALWVPAAVRPGTGAAWSELDPRRVRVGFDVGDDRAVVTYRLHPQGLPVAAQTVAWGDPTGRGLADWWPYGGWFSEHRTYAGTTVPSTAVLGWFPEDDRWTETVRLQLTGWEPLATDDTAARIPR